MSSRIREALVDLEQDVASVRFEPPEAVRARGESRRRRQVIGVVAAVVAGVAVTGAVALPVLQSRRPHDAQLLGVAAQPSASCTAVAPSSAPTKLPPEEAMKDLLPDSRTAKVFLAHTATPADKAAIEAKLRSLSVVTSLDFVDHQSAWQRFAEQLCYAPDLVAMTSPDQLPESFHLVLKQPGDLAAVQSALAGMAGFGDVFHTAE